MLFASIRQFPPGRRLDCQSLCATENRGNIPLVGRSKPGLSTAHPYLGNLAWSIKGAENEQELVGSAKVPMKPILQFIRL